MKTLFLICLLNTIILKNFAQIPPEIVPDSFFYYFKTKGVEQAVQYI